MLLVLVQTAPKLGWPVEHSYISFLCPELGQAGDYSEELGDPET